jgi:hypothetical protein
MSNIKNSCLTNSPPLKPWRGKAHPSHKATEGKERKCMDRN